MMATLKERVDETPAEAFLSTAQQYHLAAATLLPLYQRAESPLYFLFAHAIELALKAYLRSRGLSAPRGQRGHALQGLFEQCQRKGLQVGCDLRNVIHLLESENKQHGFRYFVFEPKGRPDINYLREVVDELMGVVEEEVHKKPTKGLSGAVLKFHSGQAERRNRRFLTPVASSVVVALGITLWAAATQRLHPPKEEALNIIKGLHRIAAEPGPR